MFEILLLHGLNLDFLGGRESRAFVARLALTKSTGG